jgi:hypothetical protein
MGHGIDAAVSQKQQGGRYQKSNMGNNIFYEWLSDIGAGKAGIC